MPIFKVSWHVTVASGCGVVDSGIETVCEDTHESAWAECERRIKDRWPGRLIKPDAVIQTRQ